MSSKEPVQTVVELYETLRDSRIEDMLALVDPEVICKPLVRPGLSVYYRRDGMIRLCCDLHTAYGQYQIEINEITEQDGPQVTVQARILPEPARKQPPRSVRSVYTFRHNLIASIESLNDTSTL
jgi:hypothetical protein